MQRRVTENTEWGRQIGAACVASLHRGLFAEMLNSNKIITDTVMSWKPQPTSNDQVAVPDFIVGRAL